MIRPLMAHFNTNRGAGHDAQGHTTQLQAFPCRTDDGVELGLTRVVRTSASDDSRPRCASHCDASWGCRPALHFTRCGCAVAIARACSVVSRSMPGHTIHDTPAVTARSIAVVGSSAIKNRWQCVSTHPGTLTPPRRSAPSWRRGGRGRRAWCRRRSADAPTPGPNRPARRRSPPTARWW